MSKRTLRLRRENLGDLHGDELARLAGGTHLTCDCTAQLTHGLCEVPHVPTLPVGPCLSIGCLTRDATCIC